MIFKYPTGQLYFCRAQQNTGMTAYPKHARNTPCFRQHIAGSLAVNRHSFPVVVSLYSVVLRSSTRRFDTATSPRIKGTGKRPAERMYRRRQPVPLASGQTYRAAKPGSPRRHTAARIRRLPGSNVLHRIHPRNADFPKQAHTAPHGAKRYSATDARA